MSGPNRRNNARVDWTVLTQAIRHIQSRHKKTVAELCSSLQANSTLRFIDSIEKLSILEFQQMIQGRTHGDACAGEACRVSAALDQCFRQDF
jgi:hypothetical protein